MAKSIVHVLAEVATEDLSPGIKDTLPEIDSFFREIYTSWQNVSRNEMGRPAVDASGNFIYGSNWVFRWIWRAAIGGRYAFTNPNPNLATESGLNVNVWASNSDFGGITDYVFARHANPYVSLAEARGTIILPWQLLRANKITGVLTDIVADEVAANVQLIAQSNAVGFFSRNPNWAEVGRTSVDKPGAGVAHRAVVAQKLDGTASTAHLTWRQASSIYGLAVEDQISRFRPGMSVDIWEVRYLYDAGVPANSDVHIVKLNTDGWIVDQCDYIGGTASGDSAGFEAVTFVTKQGGAATNAPAAVVHANDLVVYIATLEDSMSFTTGASNLGVDVVALADYTAGTTTAGGTANERWQTFMDALLTAASGYAAWVGHTSRVATAYGPDGLVSFIKTAYNQTLYGISMARMPNLLSLSHKLASADFLTEKLCNALIGWHRTQYGEKKHFDSLIMTDGVMNGFMQNTFAALANGTVRQVWERDAKAASVKTGWSQFMVSYRGRDYKIYDSPMVSRRQMFGVKTRDNNFRRLVPPPIPGSASKEGFGGDIEFVAPLGGHKGPFMWERNPTTGGITDFVGAPYVQSYQFFVTDPQALRVRNLKEVTGLLEV